MRTKILLVAALIAVAACAQTGRHTPQARMGNEPADARASAKAEDNRALAGAGSSAHGPGSPRYQRQ
jgi:hypothetical protein